MTCPLCIAAEGLAILRALNAGHDATWRGTRFKVNGKPLCYATQAGVAEDILDQIVQAGAALCTQHRGARRSTNPDRLIETTPLIRAAVDRALRRARAK
jgi:alkanesulfonate monooxygenase SsuD/methylene tetrahydromethanopterin reductase-like flavin-dependent oxidoreductase (luciferase family)